MNSWSDLSTKPALGTMNFGSITSPQESFDIMDTALDLGVIFFDTAELYSVPTSAKTYGLTEKIIGDWIKNRKSREKIYLASKVVGPNRGSDSYIRNGKTRFDKKNITIALNNSLKRLNTDYLDLYQLHWPDRNLNTFGTRNFKFTEDEIKTPIQETLAVLQNLQKSGKIREIGVSNESPWGLMKYIELAKYQNLPKIKTIQNNYSLLTRSFETSLSEITHRESIPLIAYSPLAFGSLVDFERPNGRFNSHPNQWARYRTKEAKIIIEKYRNLAKFYNLTLPDLALSFVSNQKFVDKVLLGPANKEQLISGVKAINLKLNAEIIQKIEEIHETHPNLAP